MTFEAYQKRIWEICGGDVSIPYVEWGLIAEIGEYAGNQTKRIRGDGVSDLDIKLELGDIAWMIAARAELKGETIIDIDGRRFTPPSRALIFFWRLFWGAGFVRLYTSAGGTSVGLRVFGRLKSWS
ncbi:MAG: hypothetical protein CSA11_12025 [Chloroflexi bacterium]|nr:MAG: hypothetical protein CSA11_12025 [Chloroflexota bacterium]